MSLLEWLGESYNPGPIGEVEIGRRPRTAERWLAASRGGPAVASARRASALARVACGTKPRRPSTIQTAHFAAGTAQIRTDPSLHPAARDLPSGLNATTMTPSGQGRADSSRPDPASH